MLSEVESRQKDQRGQESGRRDMYGHLHEVNLQHLQRGEARTRRSGQLLVILILSVTLIKEIKREFMQRTCFKSVNQIVGGTNLISDILPVNNAIPHVRNALLSAALGDTSIIFSLVFLCKHFT
ncbi:hypothetical protein J6590_069553 [Homalodisca vitripennis]|nr:hypothetical protein J6590_069553 [Homalodisca vitripennis]